MKIPTTAQLNMEQYTHELTDDLIQSIQLAEENPIRIDADKVQNIIICGMGGSGIGGMLAKDILSNHLRFPIDFCKSYHLPNYANENSLVICSSYSGNTEETIALFEQAVAKKAQIIAICSGGYLAELCIKNKVKAIIIQGSKQPRAAVGLSLVQQLHVLGTLFLSDSEKKALFEELKQVCEVLKSRKQVYQEQAHEIAKELNGKNISVVAETKYDSLVTRFAQQINENAKQKIITGVIPEMNHNQLVAFSDFDDNDAVIFVNGKYYHPQNLKRLEFLTQRLKKQNSQVIEIIAEGKTNVELFVKTLYLMDLVSVELAKLKEVDPEEVEVIHSLKKILQE